MTFSKTTSELWRELCATFNLHEKFNKNKVLLVDKVESRLTKYQPES